jgi:ribose 5-phosphate isomerase B
MYTLDMIYLGADHRGFQLKEKVKNDLIDQGYQVTDLGAEHLNSQDDYVDFALKVAEAVKTNTANKGILLCGSGAGVDMVANKVDGIRSALVEDEQRAIQAREHEDANILSLPADILHEEEAIKIIKAFLNTEFSGEERHIRRINKMEEVESSN